MKGCSLSIKLQTPSGLEDVPTDLGSSPVTIEPNAKPLSTIIKAHLKSLGQHTLRVTVNYGDDRVVRKFYKFTVEMPLKISASTSRIQGANGRLSRFVRVDVENLTDCNLSLDRVDLVLSPDDHVIPYAFPGDGGRDSASKHKAMQKDSKSSFVFRLPEERTSSKIGHALVTWRKSMGELGQIASSVITDNTSLLPATAQGADETWKVTASCPAFVSVGKVCDLSVTVLNNSRRPTPSAMIYYKANSGIVPTGLTVHPIQPLAPNASCALSFKILPLVPGLNKFPDWSFTAVDYGKEWTVKGEGDFMVKE